MTKRDKNNSGQHQKFVESKNSENYDICNDKLNIQNFEAAGQLSELKKFTSLLANVREIQ